MCWIQRGTNRYYIRSHREGATVRRVHLGSGPVAQAAADLDAARRLEREQDRSAWAAAESARDAADIPLEELDRLVALLVRAELVAAGYHRYDRGPWRRRRRRKVTDRGGADDA